MDINSITNLSSEQQPNEILDKTQLNPDDFIKLFLTQLTHQNPMQPTDSSAILQQMTEITSIQSSNKMQKTMTEMADKVNVALGNTQLLQASTLVGRSVEIESGSSPLAKTSDGQKLQGAVFIPSAANNVTVNIIDPNTKKVVKTVQLGNAESSGLMNFDWNGKDSSGQQMDLGYYNMEASADIAGNKVPLDTAGAFRVNSVGLDQIGILFNVDGLGDKRSGDILKIM